MYCYSLIDGKWCAVDPTLAEHASENGDYDSNIWIMDVDEQWQVHYGAGSVADINTPGTLSSITRSMIEQAGYAPRHNK